MVVHLPIALAVLMPPLALGIHVAQRRGWLPPRTWALVVLAQALLVASGILALRTGEADEERVDAIVSESILHQHESAAEVFVLAAGFVLMLTITSLLLQRSRWAAPIAIATLAGTVVVLALGYRVGKAGGELVYTHGAASAFATAGTVGAPPLRRHDGEDR
jgi:hypothetical protein